MSQQDKQLQMYVTKQKYHLSNLHYLNLFTEKDLMKDTEVNAKKKEDQLKELKRPSNSKPTAPERRVKTMSKQLLDKASKGPGQKCKCIEGELLMVGLSFR